MNVMNIRVNYFISMEQGMIRLQDKIIELNNDRGEQSICMDQLIWENISTKKILY